jgi:hypothetical protein
MTKNKNRQWIFNVRGDFGWQDYGATDGKTFGGIQKASADAGL